MPRSRGVGALRYLTASLFVSAVAHARPPALHGGTAAERAARSAAIRAAFGRGPEHPLGPGPRTVATPRFALVVDDARSLPAPPWATDAAYAEAFELARGAVDAIEPDGARLMLVFSTFRDGGDALFYTALANDVSGLGAGDEARLFDTTEDSPLEGYVWMGALDALDEGGPTFAEEAFLHEIAHRWAAYVRVDHPDLPPEALLGRSDAHWSFFASTRNSPMEGNQWREHADGYWATDFGDPPTHRFFPLDLYLMGVLPPSEVPPMHLLEDAMRVEPSWFVPRASDPPAHRLGLEVRIRPGAVHTVTIEDVVRGSGPRSPPADWPVALPVWIVLLDDGHGVMDPDALAAFDRRLVRLIEAFETATGGRMSLAAELTSAGRLPLGAACRELAACDRRFADRCVSPTPDGPTRCSRSCFSHFECGAGCCVGTQAPGLCGPPGEVCGPPPPPPGDADAGIPDAGPDGETRASRLDAAGARGCRGAGRADTALGWVLALAGWGLAQASRRARQSARSPAAASASPALR